MRNTILAGVLALGAIGGGVAVHQATSSSPQQSSTGCGVERWAIKTGTDAGASRVNLNQTTWASVHSMQGFARPATLPATTRISPVETTVYRLTATLVQIKAEGDSDYHLVIQGTAGRHMIAEIPSLNCLGSPDPFAARIAMARSTVDNRLRPSGSWQVVNMPIALTGVGFFDFQHGQAGVAPNAIELHPILSVRFLSSAPEFRTGQNQTPPFHDPPGGAD